MSGSMQMVVAFCKTVTNAVALSAHIPGCSKHVFSVMVWCFAESAFRYTQQVPDK